VNFEPTAIVGLESCLFFNNFIIKRLLVSLILITGIFKGLIQVAGYWLSRGKCKCFAISGCIAQNTYTCGCTHAIDIAIKNFKPSKKSIHFGTFEYVQVRQYKQEKMYGDYSM